MEIGGEWCGFNLKWLLRKHERENGVDSTWRDCKGNMKGRMVWIQVEGTVKETWKGE